MVKDLSRIGRNLKKMVIIDDTPQNYRFHKDNAISISSWKGNQSDQELDIIKGILVQIAKKEPEDITV